MLPLQSISRFENNNRWNLKNDEKDYYLITYYAHRS